MGKKADMTFERFGTIKNDYYNDMRRTPTDVTPKAMQKRIDQGRYTRLSDDFIGKVGCDLVPFFEDATMINLYVPKDASYARQLYVTNKRRFAPFIIVRSSYTRRYAWRIPMVPRNEHPMYI